MKVIRLASFIRIKKPMPQLLKPPMINEGIQMQN